LLRDKRAVVLPSATLASGGSLQIFCRTLGLDRVDGEAAGGGEGESGAHPRCRTVIIPSPFRDIDRRIIVPADAPSGDFRGRDEWLAYVQGILPRLVTGNRGGALVLFASHRDLRRTEEAVGEALTAAGFPVLSQRPGVPTSELSEEFRAVRESVLFGTETFWHGVDFRGETLTLVVITRIPFPHPGEPLQVGRRRALTDGEYWERYRYDTAIRLKQGIGRLIRGEEDRGTVVILDSRYPNFQRVQRLGLPVDGDDPFARR
jgi:ATP-dependent DNA helicase DinG